MTINKSLRTAFLTLMTATGIAATAQVQYTEDVTWSIRDLTVQTSTTVSVPVMVSNSVDLSGWQCDITVPEEVTVTGISLNHERTSDHNGTFCLCGDNRYRYVVASFSFSGTAGDSGRLFSVDMQVDATPGTYEIAIDNIRCTDTDREQTQELVCAPCTATLNVVERPTTVFALTDGQAYDNTTSYYGVDVTYTRTFKNTNTQAFYVPFDMPYSAWESLGTVAEVNNIHQYFSDDGTLEKTTVEFVTIKPGGKVQANKPYVFRAHAGSTTPVTFSCTNTNLLAAEDGMINFTSARMKYTLVGLNQTKTDMHSSGAWALNQGSFMQATSDAAKVGPNRFYLLITERDDDGNYNTPEPSHLPKRIEISIDGEVDGIIDVITDTPYTGDDALYDLTGRKVVNPTGGIYIRNGRKVIIK